MSRRLSPLAGPLAGLGLVILLSACDPTTGANPFGAALPQPDPADFPGLCVARAAAATQTPRDEVKVLQSLALPQDDAVTVAIPGQGHIRCTRDVTGGTLQMVWASGGPPAPAAEPAKPAKPAG